MKLHHLSIAVLAAISLAACGGGGSGDTPATPTTPPVVTPPPPVVTVPPTYTLTPATVELAHVAGYPASATLSGRQTVAFTANAYIKATVDSDIIDPAIVITPTADATFTLRVSTLASAKPGRYTGNITVSACSDVLCANPMSGSPFKLPYDIEVVSPEGGVTVVNASPLSPLEGAPNWATFQGNPQHTGYVPVTLNPSVFSARWKWTPPARQGVQLVMSTLATGAGLIYVSTGGSLSNKDDAYVAAYRESDGTQAWKYSFNDLIYPSANPPAYDGGKVYIAAGSQQSTALYGLQADNGTRVFKSSMSSQWEKYLAPTVFGGKVYTNGGTYGGLYSFGAGMGELGFFTSLQQYDGWTPAVDAQNLFAYVGGALQSINPVTGAVRGSIADPEYQWNGYSTSGAPVIGANGLVLAGNLSNRTKNAIVAFDTLKSAVRWSATGAYSGNPAYADGTVFAGNNATHILEARSEADGSLIWSWTAPVGDNNFVSDVLATKNLVFISTAKTTYAIDRTSHASVWSYSKGGALALSANGVLYIRADNGIVAINLK